MFIKTFLSVLLSFFFISFFSISYTQDYVDVSLKEIDMNGNELVCPPSNGFVQDVVIAPVSGMSGVGIGWGANLYLQSEIGAANTIYDLTWIIGTSTNYSGTKYTFDNTDIWMYEYTGSQFPSTTRPDVQTWSTGTLPAGVSNLVKVMSNGKIVLTDVGSECISSTENSLDIPYVYSGTKSLVIYIEKKTKATNSTGSTIAWPAFKHNTRQSGIRRVCNWEGTIAVPLNSNSIATSSKKFARVVFNRVKANRKINKSCSTTQFLGDCVISTCVIKSITPSATSVCKGGVDITFTKDPTNVAGTFSSTSGLVIDATTGKINATASYPGNYTVTFTETADANCKVTANIEIKESGDASKIAITSNTPICKGDNAVFTITGIAGQKVTYTGVTSANTSPITLDGTGKAIVTVTNVTSDQTITLGTVSNSTNTCPTTITGSNSTATVVVNPKPVISDITKSICSGLKFDTIPVANATNTIPAGTKYTWAVVADPEITGASPEASPQTNISQTLSNSATMSKIATYTVTATSGTAPNQCTSTFKVTITVNPKPPAAPLFTLTSQPTCSANGIAQVTPFLASPAVYIFKPSTGISIDGTGKITASTGKYKFVVIKDGCASDSSELLTMNDVPGKPTAPTKIISSGETTFCEGEFINLTASTIPAGATVNWTKNGTLFGNTNPLKVTESGTYAVSYTANGCTSFENDTIVTVNPLPSKPTITNADLNQQFCVSENADVSKLKPTSGVVWFDVNGNIKNNLAELLTETSYYAAIKDANGCYTKSTDRIEVKVKIIQNPLSPVIGGPIVFCKADNKSIADLTPKSTITTEIRWFSNTDLTTPIPYIPATPLITGQYVPKSYENGCYSLNTTPISVTIEDPQAPALPTSKLCENNTISPKLFDFYANNNSIYYYSSNTSLIALANKNLVKGLNEKYYVRTVTNNGCYSAATEINIDLYFSSGIGVLPSPLVLTPVLCEIDKPDFALVEAKYNALPSTNGTIFWYQGKNDLLENNLPKNIQINSGSYWIAVKGADGCFSKKQEVKLTVDSGIKPTLKPIDLCYTSEYKVADLNIANVSNPIGILTWYYAKNGTVILKDLDPITNDPNVEYWATYKKTNTECESSEKVKLNLSWIKFNQPLQLDETSQKFCKSKTNKVSDLNISPNTSSNVAWFQTLTESTPIDPTTNLFEDKYYAAEFLMTTDNKYCVNSQRKMVDVTFYSPKLYPLVKESVCTKQNGSIEFLNPPAGYIFNWYETSNINVLDFTGAKYSKPLEKQSFKIVMEDAKGCKDEVTISMPACSDALIPQFLTPQSPGGNDKWVINFSAKYTKVQVRVFNRWGNEVYVSPIPYTDDWDGKRNNEYLPTGTYYYVIDKGNGDPIVTGFIELVK